MSGGFQEEKVQQKAEEEKGLHVVYISLSCFPPVSEWTNEIRERLEFLENVTVMKKQGTEVWEQRTVELLQYLFEGVIEEPEPSEVFLMQRSSPFTYEMGAATWRPIIGPQEPPQQNQISWRGPLG